jgi:hypothetical protein
MVMTKSFLRLRNWFLWVVPAAILLGLWLTDPDGGASTGIWLLRFTVAFLAMAAAHLARRFLFDYPEADGRSLFARARETPTGAGLALIAISIVMVGAMLVFSSAARAQDVRTFIPPPCLANLEILKGERLAYWPDHPAPQLLPALAEHESCTSLTHSRCCNPKSRLKSAREEGAGLGQITRTWRKDGTQRFDSLAELRDRHPALGEWSWENVYQRQDLQNRALILMGRDNFRFFKRVVRADAAALAFADAGYNGGNGGVQNERRACQITAGCDPQQWFGHVERHCLKSRDALYGARSACDINRHHVKDVTQVREVKYRGLV